MSTADDYYAQVAGVVTANRAEIEADLAEAQRRLGAAERARDASIEEVAEAERQVANFHNLLAIADGLSTTPPSSQEPSMTLHDAMREVLRTAPGRRMVAADIATQIDRRGLYKMRDGRAVEKQQIHARVGHYPKVFNRDGNGGIGLI